MKEKIREAIQTIKSNWPNEHYSMLREALTVLIDEVSERDSLKKCTICKWNKLARHLGQNHCTICKTCVDFSNWEDQEGDRCPVCGAPEIPASTPRTVYSCGSSTYDGRPGTYRKGDSCICIKELGSEVEDDSTEDYTLEMLLDDLRWYGGFLPDKESISQNYTEVTRKCEELFQKVTKVFIK